MARRAARIRFLPDWREDVEGELVPGGRVAIEYALERVQQIFTTPAGAPVGDVIAEALFSPGGQSKRGRADGEPFELTVPKDAAELAVWFHAADRSGGTAWDSRFGENYRFTVAARA